MKNSSYKPIKKFTKYERGIAFGSMRFSSISTYLKNHISESNQMSQPDFLYELFEDFMDDPANQDFSMDNGLVCRWLTGQAKISPKNICLLFRTQ